MEEDYKKRMYKNLLEQDSKYINYYDKITERQWKAIYSSYDAYNGNNSTALKVYNNICKSFETNPDIESIKNSILKYKEDIQIMFPELYTSLEDFIKMNPSKITKKEVAIKEIKINKIYIAIVLVVMIIIAIL